MDFPGTNVGILPHGDGEVGGCLFTSESAVEDYAEIKVLEPRMELRLEADQAILDDIAPTDARAKKFKPQEFYDRRYLDEMERSGYFDRLWAGAAIR